MDTIAFTETELKDLDLNILTAIKNIRKNNQRADVANVHHEVVKIINFEQTSQTVIDERLKLLLEISIKYLIRSIEIKILFV